MIDIKKGADNVTISYNYMHDHHKVSMNGYSDDDSAVRHVTFHHNLFENVGSRTPLQRFGYSHMLNNYLYKVLVSGINVRMGGYSLVEANYFETVLNPVTARDSTAVGYWTCATTTSRAKPTCLPAMPLASLGTQATRAPSTQLTGPRRGLPGTARLHLHRGPLPVRARWSAAVAGAGKVGYAEVQVGFADSPRLGPRGENAPAGPTGSGSPGSRLTGAIWIPSEGVAGHPWCRG